MAVSFPSTRRLISGSLLIAFLLALGSAAFAQDRQASQEGFALVIGDKTLTGVANDWASHHSVYSDPGTEEQAIASGTHEHWLRIVNSPRYLMQQLHRQEPARGPYASQIARIEASMKDAKMKDRENAGARAHALESATASVPDPEPTIDSEATLMERISQELHRKGLPPASTSAPFARPRRRWHHEPGIPGHDVPGFFDQGRLQEQMGTPGEAPAEDPTGQKPTWSIGNAGAPTGKFKIPANSFPAVWQTSASTTSCTTDFTAYPTANYGSTLQATIIAYNNRYAGCGTVPSTYWAYNTGTNSAITGSPIIYAYNPNLLAFVQYSSTSPYASSLVLLKWKANNGTLTSPVTPASATAANFSTCTAPCMTVLPLSGGHLDYWSNPYYDYGSDTIYVGDSGGYLHKFTGVFKGAPAEATGNWPLLLQSPPSAGYSVASPVLDEGTGYVFVGDTNGYLYAITPAGGIASNSAEPWGAYPDFGFYDAPLIDNTALAQYFFLTSYSYYNPNTGVTAVYNAVLNFSPQTATCPPCDTDTLAALVGITGYNSGWSSFDDYTAGQLYAGAFDDVYYTSANESLPSGNLYVMGNTGGYNAYLNYSNVEPGSTLYQISITGNAVTANTLGNNYGYNAEDYANNGPLTEFYNANAATDYLFVTTEATNDYDGFEHYIPSCFQFHIPPLCPSANYGCAMSFSATAFGSTQPALGEWLFCSYENQPATGGFAIDNDVTSGGANIYFNTVWIGTTLPCATSGDSPCAVQAPQAEP